jgi:hypothetical protein
MSSTKAASASSPNKAATKTPKPVRIEDLRLIKKDDPEYDLLSSMAEGAICAFQSLGSSYTLPKKLTLETPSGPVSVLMGHTETVPYAHDPCAWCVKFRPQDLTAHEHVQVYAENADLPTLGEESYPDVIINTPYGMVYAWDEIAISPDLDVEAAHELMLDCEERWTDLARIQLDAQLTTFKRLEPEADIEMLRQFYNRMFASEEHDQLDLIEFVRVFEETISSRGGIAEALRIFGWIQTSPQKGRSIQTDLLYTYPF